MHRGFRCAFRKAFLMNWFNQELELAAVFSESCDESFVRFVVQRAVPLQIGPFAAHPHTGNEFEGKTSGFLLQSFCISRQLDMLSAVWACAQFQTVGISQSQTGNSFDDCLEETLLNTIAVGDWLEHIDWNTSATFLLYFPEQSHQCGLISGCALLSVVGYCFVKIPVHIVTLLLCQYNTELL